VDGGRIRPAITWRWSEGAVEYMVDRMVDSVLDVLREHKVEKERSASILSIWPPSLPSRKRGKGGERHAGLSAARVVKTPDEIELLKQSAAIADACTYKARYEWAKPGITERELSGKMIEYMYEKGCEIVYEILSPPAAIRVLTGAGRPTRSSAKGIWSLSIITRWDPRDISWTMCAAGRSKRTHPEGKGSV